MADQFAIAIIGAGPGGLSAAARAAEQGASYILLESSAAVAKTIQSYQKGKHVMAEPSVLPLRSGMQFAAGKREQVLDAWNKGVKQSKLNIRYNAEVLAIKGKKGNFNISLNGGESIKTEHVVLAIGLQGNLRQLTIPGAESACVQYNLDDPDAYHDENIAVVGAGDAAIENALALADRNTVFLINRRQEFARAKEANSIAILQAIDSKKVHCFYNSVPLQLDEGASAKDANALTLETAEGKARIPVHRVIARLGAIPPRKFVESCGIKFPNEDANAVPELTDRYETNVKGIYIIGALGGYPLIKQCMNQGYEVVEYILGNDVEPADEPLLQEKCNRLVGKPKVSEVLTQIRESVPIFQGLTTLQLREFLIDSELHNLSENDLVFEYNDYTSSFYSIISGSVKIRPGGEANERLVILSEGQFFGEMSLISGRRRSATVQAASDCVLLETPRNTMNKLINSIESVKRTIDEVFIVRALQTNFAPRAEIGLLQEIAQTCQLRHYKAGDVVFSEGDEAKSLQLVRRGSLMVSRKVGGKDVVLSYVPAGQYVGEMGLMGGGKRFATVTAAIATETIELTADAFQLLLIQDPELRDKIDNEYKQRLSQNLKMQEQPGGGDIISFLMSQGVGEATDVLLIDESLCVRCDNCETACAETHAGTSRLKREAGPTFAYIHLPTSCRHCEHPHCMKDCPPDAIHRSADGEVYIADNCIGCGNCERNCPYGVIQMAQPSPRKPGLLSWLLTGHGPGPGQIDFERYPKYAKKLKKDTVKKAVKCDMCKDVKGGAACVRACPTGAAMRINPGELPDYLSAKS